jgi:hypothetical protein
LRTRWAIVSPADEQISELERGIRRNDDLAQTYRDWLAAA